MPQQTQRLPEASASDVQLSRSKGGLGLPAQNTGKIKPLTKQAERFGVALIGLSKQSRDPLHLTQLFPQGCLTWRASQGEL